MAEHLGEIVAVMQERFSAAIKLIDDNVRMTDGVYKLAGNVEALTAQVKNMAD